ncbi:RDD family protein [Streptomyces sp. Ru73]|uniref:RDD family protein n=1 Tax=Streptomyces sp. Ru73 TaxID=2080748 RepID=UPI000CDE4F6A|nr:RDD family protein [Streptomyces sp. Ru73]POX40792.1 RDD family protein [Streptomyces sp. Ru73]
MSAPSSGSAGGSPTPGYYPDPSIPGYIRYWNGAAWVPGTSRPAPAEGEAMPAPPPGAAVAPPAAAQPAAAQPAAAEETGPVFFDEEEDSGQVDGPAAEGDALAVRERGEVDTPPAADWDDPRRLHGNSPGAAASWQADASQQAGFGGEQDRRVSWGAVPAQRDDAGAPAGGQAWGDPAADGAGGGEQEGSGAAPAGKDAERADAGDTAGAPQTEDAAQPAAGVPEGTMAIRAVGPGTPADGTVAIRAVRPGAAGDKKGAAAQGTPPADGTMAIRLDRGGARQDGPAAGAPAAQHPAPQQPPAQPRQDGYGYPQQSAPSVPNQGGYGYPQQAGSAAGAPQQSGYGYPQPGPSAPQQGGYGYPQQSGPSAPQPGPAAPQQGGAPESVIPWKPPADNPFLQAAQAQGRPAPLGRRIAARLIDTVVLGGLLAGVAVPLWNAAADHIDAKVEAAKQSGVQTTVYLLDGTTGGYLAIVIAVLLVVGLLYEALPMAKWGFTLGKKVCGVRVLDIEGHDTPEFAAALKRWLVYGVLGVLVVGVVNVLWCLVDRPWRQCWHDKAARTFVAEG